MTPRILAGCLALGLLAAAPRAGAQDASSGTVQGVVFDSIRGHPLRDATVQLVSTADTGDGRTWAARTDSAGHFRIPALPPGTYLSGFFHPLLDSLGFEGEKRALRVGPGLQRLDFALPSPATIAAAICPHVESGDSTGLLIGHVRATDDERPIEGASVAAGWTELVRGALLVKPEERRSVAETTPEGWFALCGLPGETPLLVRAARGADSSGYIRLTVPPRGFVHMPFFVGGGLTAPNVVPDSSPEDTPPASPSRAPLLRGRAWLRGTVRDDRGLPIPGANALLWGTGLEAQTNTRGSFALDSLPGGTHTLEVRAVGFAPVHRVVHLAESRPAQVEVRLGERAVALPTVAVRGRASAQIAVRQFYERMRDAEKGINRGYFIAPEELERRKPAFLTQMLDGFPGILVAKDPLDQRKATVRGPLRTGMGGQRCTMTVFLDGRRVLPTLSGRIDDHIDELVDPTAVAAVEIYPHPTSAPPQFQSLNGVCGVILIWTR